MKLTRLIILGLAFLLPATATMVRAEDKAAAPAEGAAEGEKKGKKGKKAKKAEGAAEGEKKAPEGEKK